MEARIDGEGQSFYGYRAMDVGKKSVEWDLNDWKWDGHLFVATPLNPMDRQFFPLGNSSNASSSCSDEGNNNNTQLIVRTTREVEKKRRASATGEDNNNNGFAVGVGGGELTLKLGENGYDLNGEREGNSSAKKTKLGGGGVTNRSVCQVENCEADLSKVKDYHRRHKVCEIHSKATSALVGGIMQRFCQQCSRFHVLQEFDEGKRSCRRRLAGHNKRRRKTNPEPGATVNPLSDDNQSSNLLLISLLKILSNMHSNGSDHPLDQDLMPHLLKSLVSHAGEQLGKSLVELLLQGGSQASLNIGNTGLLAIEQAPQEDLKQAPEPYANGTATGNRSEKQAKVNDFDLNDIYVDSDDGTDIERSPPSTNPATSSPDYPSWIQQTSPPQTSRNSDSASDQSPSSSRKDAQMRTGRIVFKLFGKEPNDFPVVLRGQILDWLSHSPTDIESYIRPGCIVLTIYLRQAETAWEELSDDMGFSVSKLLDLSDDPLWTSGWIYVRVQNQYAFVFDGQVVVDTSLPLRSHDYSHIISVRPLAVAATQKAQFTVKGINLSRRGTRLLCAVEGKYLIQETTRDPRKENDGLKENNEIVECVNFSCDLPITSGRGFMEIEDQGLSSSFFPFIVVEEDDVCSEIRILETTLEFTDTDSAKQALEFIHEIGWLLHRSKLGESDPNPDVFSVTRFKWLIEFSMDREWCAVIRKLLNMFFDGAVGDSSSSNAALSELCLLHRAVRKNSKPMVEMLLRYVPKQQRIHSLFRPDAAGPAGLTPLHIAAGKDGSEDVLDALTEDPSMVGIEAWRSSRDSTGFTPEDYARLRGHFSYIHLIQRKINKKSATEDHVVVNIPVSFSDREQKGPKSGSALEITHAKHQLQCKLCDHKLVYGRARRSVAYRPAMLSMVAIAAVCVCVALLFKSCPEVLYVFQPFRWELLDYGTR